MPHASLKLIPGVDQNRTPALNEAAISESNLIRFVPDRNGLGLPQKIGGWDRFISDPMTAIVRALWAWADTDNGQRLAVGTEDGVYAYNPGGGGSSNVSPQFYVANPAMSFSATNGSNVVQITDAGSNVTSYDSIFLSTQVTIGGLVLFGFYPCVGSSSNTYSILSKNIIGLPVNATSTDASGKTAIFNTVSGKSSVTVTLAGHTFQEGSTFPILIPTTVGGITLSGNYIVRTVAGDDFTILAVTEASSSATVSMNSNRPSITYYIGQSALPVSLGYGNGTYGTGGYGTGVTTTGVRQFTTTNATCVGTTATISFTGRYLVPVGSEVTVSGIVPSGYNGTWITTQSTSGATSTISFTVPSTLAAQTVAGTVVVNYFGFTGATNWALDNWGEYLIANPKDAEIFYWSPNDGSQSSTIVPNAPKVNEGCFVAMPERQIIAYGSTFNGIKDPLLVRWCDIGNFTSWVGTVTNQAGSFRIPKGSRIVGGLQGPQQGFLWTDISVWSMQYIGQPLIWSFNEIGTGCGLIGRKAAASLSGTTYWMSQSQFFSVSQAGVQSIPCAIWDVIFQDIDFDYSENVICATNARFSEVSWFYPTTGSGGVPTKYVKYNTILGQWDFGTLTRTAWIDQSIFGPPIAAGGDRVIYQHEIGENADASAINAYVQTGYFALSDGELKTFVDQMWPDMKWGKYGSENQNAQVKISFHVVDYPGQTPRISEYTVNSDTTYITPRLRGRLVSIRVESNDLGSFWRLGNIRYRLQPDGKF